MIVFFDGAFLEESKVSIPIIDRGFLFGDGVYVTLLVKEGFPYFLSEQLERLYESARAFQIIPPAISLSTIYELIERNNATRGRYKLQIIVTGGSDPTRGLPKRPHGHTLMLLKPAAELPKNPLKCTLYPNYLESAHSRYKTLAHFNRYAVAEYARKTGFDDALTTNYGRKELFEASFANIFWVVEDHLFTPDPAYPLHFGITIGKVLQHISELNLKTSFVRTPLQAVPEEAFLFRASSLMGILPIVQVDQRQFRRNHKLENSFLNLLEEHAKGANAPSV